MTPHSNLALLDWDGTLRKGYVLFDWVGHLVSKEIVAKEAHSQLTSLLFEYQNSKLSYRDLVINTANIYSVALRGTQEQLVSSLASDFVQHDRKHLFEFTIPLLSHLQARNISICIISGAPQSILVKYANLLPIDAVFGLSLETDARGIYTGAILENHGLYETKQKVTENLTKNHQHVVLAIGNSKSDLPLLQAASNSFMIEPEGLGDFSDIAIVNRTEVLNAVTYRLRGS